MKQYNASDFLSLSLPLLFTLILSNEIKSWGRNIHYFPSLSKLREKVKFRWMIFLITPFSRSILHFSLSPSLPVSLSLFTFSSLSHRVTQLLIVSREIHPNTLLYTRILICFNEGCSGLLTYLFSGTNSELSAECRVLKKNLRGFSLPTFLGF